MSLHSPETTGLSRRAWLGWAAMAGLSPLLARSECPCGQDDLNPASKDAGAATRPMSASTQPTKVIRVCTDPNNLPYSNRNHEGFEDKIAELMSRELDMPLEYDWLPQRLGFFRTAFKTFDSTVVMAAPAGFGRAAITRPYYRSTYVFVTRRGDKNAPKHLDDPVLRTIKLGVQLTGSDTPATHALAARKLIDNVSGYPVFDESEGKPAERIVAAVASGEIDTAIVWGPQAGYFAKRQAVPLDLVPVTPDPDVASAGALPFSFEICMAVRRSEKNLVGWLNAVIGVRREEIDQILKDFSVPLLPLAEGGKHLEPVQK